MLRIRVVINNFAFKEGFMETDKDFVLKFGLRVQQQRKKLGLSQEELAFRAGFHRTYIGMIERGERNITLSNLAKLARALEVDIKQLF